MKKEKSLLSLNEFQAYQKEGYTIIDSRPASQFADGFIPDSINIQIDSTLPEYSDLFLIKNQFFLLVAPQGQESAHAAIFENSGYNNILGCLTGGFEAWQQTELPIDLIISISPEEFGLEYAHGNLFLIDIREQEAFDLLYIENSVNFEPEVLVNNYERLDDAFTNCIYCVNGQLSMTLISFLKTNGKHNLYHLEGGFAAVRKLTNVKMVKPGKKTDILEKFKGKDLN